MLLLGNAPLGTPWAEFDISIHSTDTIQYSTVAQSLLTK